VSSGAVNRLSVLVEFPVMKQGAGGSDRTRVLLIDAYYGIKPSSGPVYTDLQREGERTKVNETIKEQFGKSAVKRVQQSSSGSRTARRRASAGRTCATSCASWARLTSPRR
jgi:hypothetical protein